MPDPNPENARGWLMSRWTWAAGLSAVYVAVSAFAWNRTLTPDEIRPLIVARGPMGQLLEFARLDSEGGNHRRAAALPPKCEKVVEEGKRSWRTMIDASAGQRDRHIGRAGGLRSSIRAEAANHDGREHPRERKRFGTHEVRRRTTVLL